MSGFNAVQSVTIKVKYYKLRFIIIENIFWNENSYYQLHFSGFKNTLYHKLLTSIQELISKEEYQSNVKKTSNILRIGIHSLGSPTWMAMDCDADTSGTFGQDLIKFMYCLRVIVRDTNAVVFVTIPAHLFDVSVMNSYYFLFF